MDGYLEARHFRQDAVDTLRLNKIKFTHLVILHLIVTHTCDDYSCLALKLSQSKSSISVLLGELLEKGLLIRLENKYGDRRYIRFKATRLGLRLYNLIKEDLGGKYLV